MDVNGVYKPTYTWGGPILYKIQPFLEAFSKRFFGVPLMDSICFQNVHVISIQLLGIIGVPTFMETRMSVYIYIYWNMFPFSNQHSEGYRINGVTSNTM